MKKSNLMFCEGCKKVYVPCCPECGLPYSVESQHAPSDETPLDQQRPLGPDESPT